jgi:hypothetical protein
MCETIDSGSYIQWVLGFGIKTGYDREIARLLDDGFIKEVYHMDWLANPVLVPKKNLDWRMCVDYTDLNKACKKNILLAYPELIKLSTPGQVVAF